MSQRQKKAYRIKKKRGRHGKAQTDGQGFVSPRNHIEWGRRKRQHVTPQHCQRATRLNGVSAQKRILFEADLTIIKKANNRSVSLRHYFLWHKAPSRSVVRRKFIFYIQRQPSTLIKIRRGNEDRSNWIHAFISISPKGPIYTSLKYLYVFKNQNQNLKPTGSRRWHCPCINAEVQETWRWRVSFTLRLLCPWTEKQGWREQ